MPLLSGEDVEGGRSVRILRPLYFSFGKRRISKGFNTGRLTYISFLSACIRASARVSCPVDAFYGHFLYAGGASALWLAKKTQKPGFVAVGESDFWSIEAFGKQRLQADYADATGLIAVSSQIKRELHSILKVADEKIRVFPNAVDPSIFYPRERVLVRKKLGLPEERLIVAFTGHFDERKGPHRLLAATQHMPYLGFIMMGEGPVALNDPRILFKGKVRHEDIPEYLSAADMFVLPTLAEGCCNAIIEAMACGLPIVSSAKPFNDDILDYQMSLRVDPLNLKAIGMAIQCLTKDEKLRLKMGRWAVEKARQFQLPDRAKAILEWIRSKSRGECRCACN